jgi:hypothetical protein
VNLDFVDMVRAIILGPNWLKAELFFFLRELVSGRSLNPNNWKHTMPLWIKAFLILAAALVPAGVVIYVDVPGYLQHVQVIGTMPVHAAPGPIVGAGFPMLLIAGGYWLVRRFHRKNV